MTLMAAPSLTGGRTCRGIGITRTVSCQMRAAWSDALGAGPTYEVPPPFPLSVPGYPLRSRQGMYIKYFTPNHASVGAFYLIERQSPAQVANRGYPILRQPSPETRRQKRLKQVFLPITASVRIYSGNPATEPGCSLEFG